MRFAKKASRRIAAAAVASGMVAAGTLALASSASAATTGTGAAGYNFTTLDNNHDLTFNQLLGINDEGLISGYFGSGAAGHPNKGYLLAPPAYGQGSYTNENFPGSVQTQVTGLNNRGITVGFWSNTNMGVGMDANFGWVNVDGHFRQADFPTSSPASPVTDQLLGVNDSDIAVGFYNDANGNSHGYEYNINTNRYSPVVDPNAPSASLTAAAINDNGDVAGFYTNPSTGNTDGFLLSHGRFTDLSVPGSSSTSALGVNNLDEVVGVFVPNSNKNALEGFTWTPQRGFTTVNDPHGMNDGNLTTTINGVNDRGQLVGFYVDANGNTDGFLATPGRTDAFTTSAVTLNLHLQAMPQGTVSLSKGVGGDLSATVDAFGLTPGSSHTVELISRDNFAQVLGTLTVNSVGQADMTLDSKVKNMWALGSRVEILNGTAGDPVSAEPIAETTRFYGVLTGYSLRSVEVGPNGTGYGTPQGTAAISYNPAAQTVTVTVNASGLTPGAHAAHIHDGSCMSQGPVQYMLMDFVANSQGQIVNQSRTVSVTGLTGPITATGWYLNLHQGNSNNILANGQPTINFRPLLCANI